MMLFRTIQFLLVLLIIPVSLYAQGEFCALYPQPENRESFESALNSIGYTYYCSQNIGDINSDGFDDWTGADDSFNNTPIMLGAKDGAYIPAKLSKTEYLFSIDASYRDGSSLVWHRFPRGILVKVLNGPNTEESKWGDNNYDEQDLKKCRVVVYKWSTSQQMFKVQKASRVLSKYKKQLCFVLKAEHEFQGQNW